MARLNSIFESGTFVLIPERRTFVAGVASILDVSSNLQDNYAVSQTPKEADAKAIAADWRAIGEDFAVAYEWGKAQAAK